MAPAWPPSPASNTRSTTPAPTTRPTSRPTARTPRHGSPPAAPTRRPLEHGLAAVHELQVRIDRARADAARQLLQLATARAGAYADMYPEGAGMVAASDDLMQELEDELLPAAVEQLRAQENAVDALGRRLRRLQARLADRPAVAVERTATRDEVLAARRVLRPLAEYHGLTRPRVDAAGAVIVTVPAGEPGHGTLRRFAAAAAEVVGVWVTVVADDAPAAATDTTSL
ncbi:hypothetical protein ACI8AC_10205 [Geodermatophilus sp. SYSU D00758]